MAVKKYEGYRDPDPNNPPVCSSYTDFSILDMLPPDRKEFYKQVDGFNITRLENINQTRIYLEIMVNTANNMMRTFEDMTAAIKKLNGYYVDE